MQSLRETFGNLYKPFTATYDTIQRRNTNIHNRYESLTTADDASQKALGKKRTAFINLIQYSLSEGLVAALVSLLNVVKK